MYFIKDSTNGSLAATMQITKHSKRKPEELKDITEKRMILSFLITHHILLDSDNWFEVRVIIPKLLY